MQDISQLKLITMSLLQTCGYVTEQMRTPVRIDVNKFLESFSIQAVEGEIHPPSWTAREDNSVLFSPTVIPNSQSHSLTPTPSPFTMDNYSQCRRTEAIRWINLQEKRASIIARLHPVTPEEYQERRDAVNSESGPLRRKGMNFHLLWRMWHSSNVYIAPKRTAPIPNSKADKSKPGSNNKTLNNLTEYLTQRQFLYYLNFFIFFVRSNS
jgi:hypothetical protein